MTRISSKCRYALEALVDLTVCDAEARPSLSIIAQKKGISVLYLEQIFIQLRVAGNVKSIKGSKGGYFLVEAPDKLTIGRILRALEGEFSIVDEQQPDKVYGLHIYMSIKHQLWDKVDSNLNALVDSISLADLIHAKQHKKIILNI